MANFVEFEHSRTKYYISDDKIIKLIYQPEQRRYVISSGDNPLDPECWYIKYATNVCDEVFTFNTQEEAQELYDKLRGKKQDSPIPISKVGIGGQVLDGNGWRDMKPEEEEAINKIYPSPTDTVEPTVVKYPNTEECKHNHLSFGANDNGMISTCHICNRVTQLQKNQTAKNTTTPKTERVESNNSPNREESQLVKNLTIEKLERIREIAEHIFGFNAGIYNRNGKYKGHYYGGLHNSMETNAHDNFQLASDILDILNDTETYHMDVTKSILEDK